MGEAILWGIVWFVIGAVFNKCLAHIISAIIMALIFAPFGFHLSALAWLAFMLLVFTSTGRKAMLILFVSFRYGRRGKIF